MSHLDTLDNHVRKFWRAVMATPETRRHLRGAMAALERELLAAEAGERVESRSAERRR